jgi:hypothetical protein
MLQRIVLYSTLGAVLYALDHSWDTWGFWAILALFWAAETLTRRELWEQIQQQVAAWEAAHKDTKDTP